MEESLFGMQQAVNCLFTTTMSLTLLKIGALFHFVSHASADVLYGSRRYNVIKATPVPPNADNEEWRSYHGLIVYSNIAHVTVPDFRPKSYVFFSFDSDKLPSSLQIVPQSDKHFSILTTTDEKSTLSDLNKILDSIEWMYYTSKEMEKLQLDDITEHFRRTYQVPVTWENVPQNVLRVFPTKFASILSNPEAEKVEEKKKESSFQKVKNYASSKIGQITHQKDDDVNDEENDDKKGKFVELVSFSKVKAHDRF